MNIMVLHLKILGKLRTLGRLAVWKKCCYSVISNGTRLNLLPNLHSWVPQKNYLQEKPPRKLPEHPVWPLTTKRVSSRRNSRKGELRNTEVYDVTAYATCEGLNLLDLLEDLQVQGLYTQVSLPKDAKCVLAAEANYRAEGEAREVFIFGDGCVVFWNMPEVERIEILKFMKKHQKDGYESDLVQNEFERLEFTYGGATTSVIDDEIQFGMDKTELVLEKYTFSNVLGMSVKLAIWEALLLRYVDSIQWVLQDMKLGRPISVSRSDVLRKTGELYSLRHLINLSSDLLDTPDFYWDRHGLEVLYSKMFHSLSIARRTKVINDKLTYCCDLAQLLKSHLDDKHHTRLEVMIIALIMVEVLFEVVHFAQRYFEEPEGGSIAS